MKSLINGKWVSLEYSDDGKSMKIVDPVNEKIIPDFEINDSLENYAFGIRNEHFNYSWYARKTMNHISVKYGIDELEVLTLFDFVKRELPSLRNNDLTQKEKKGIRTYIESGNEPEIVTFRGQNFSFNIKNPELIKVLSKYVKRRYNFADPKGDKSFKKLVAKTLYDRLTRTLNVADYNAKIIIGLIFAQFNIALVNDRILKKWLFNIFHPYDNYLNYLERKIRSFISD